MQVGDLVRHRAKGTLHLIVAMWPTTPIAKLTGFPVFVNTCDVEVVSERR